jgi:hypothetical protein
MTSVASTTPWQRAWRAAMTRDTLSALIMTALTLFGSYGEAHSTNKADAVVNGHHVPHTPNAALLLVALMTAGGIGNPFGITGGGFFLIPALVAAALFGGIAVSNRRA